VLTPDELRRLLDAVKGERFEDVLYFCTPVGSRIGETLALRGYREADAPYSFADPRPSLSRTSTAAYSDCPHRF
jgi:hypothetical protein